MYQLIKLNIPIPYNVTHNYIIHAHYSKIIPEDRSYVHFPTRFFNPSTALDREPLNCKALRLAKYLAVLTIINEIGNVTVKVGF